MEEKSEQRKGFESGQNNGREFFALYAKNLTNDTWNRVNKKNFTNRRTLFITFSYRIFILHNLSSHCHAVRQKIVFFTIFDYT